MNSNKKLDKEINKADSKLKLDDESKTNGNQKLEPIR